MYGYRGRTKPELLQRDAIEAVAYHEAGHAVVAEVIAPGSLESVTLNRNVNSMSLTSYDGAAVAEHSIEEALIAVAGNQAARYYVQATERRRGQEVLRGERNSTWFPWLVTESGGDRAIVNGHLRAHYFSGYSAQAHRDKLERHAWRLIHENWTAVDALAQALLARGRPLVTFSRLECLVAMGFEQPKAAPAKRAMPAATGESRVLSRADLVELRAQAKKDGHALLYNILSNKLFGNRGGLERAAIGGSVRAGR